MAVSNAIELSLSDDDKQLVRLILGEGHYNTKEMSLEVKATTLEHLVGVTLTRDDVAFRRIRSLASVGALDINAGGRFYPEDQDPLRFARLFDYMPFPAPVDVEEAGTLISAARTARESRHLLVQRPERDGGRLQFWMFSVMWWLRKRGGEWKVFDWYKEDHSMKPLFLPTLAEALSCASDDTDPFVGAIKKLLSLSDSTLSNQQNICSLLEMKYGYLLKAAKRMGISH